MGDNTALYSRAVVTTPFEKHHRHRIHIEKMRGEGFGSKRLLISTPNLAVVPRSLPSSESSKGQVRGKGVANDKNMQVNKHVSTTGGSGIPAWQVAVTKHRRPLYE
jgi:hypothetical protein